MNARAQGQLLYNCNPNRLDVADSGRRSTAHAGEDDARMSAATVIVSASLQSPFSAAHCLTSLNFTH